MAFSRRAGIMIATVAVAAVAAVASAAVAAEAPYRLSVEVEYGHPRGPESFRSDLLDALRSELRSSGCFREIAPPVVSPDEVDLLFVLTLDKFLYETRYETSLGDRAASDNPAIERFVVAHVSVTVGMEVRTATAGAIVRERTTHLESSWRPVVDEDPRTMARERLIKDLVRRSRKFVCKGSPKQWEKELQRAGSAR